MANEDNEAAAQWLANGILREGSTFFLAILTEAGLTGPQRAAVANLIKAKVKAEQDEPELLEKLRALEKRGILMTRVKELADIVAAEAR